MSQSHGEVISFAEERAARTGARARCQASTDAGQPCRNYAVSDGFCRVHAPTPAPPREDPIDRPSGGIELLEGLRDALGDEWIDRIREVAAFARRRVTGDYHIDDFGFDEDFTTNVLVPLVQPLYRRYWRVTSSGIENVPEGAGILVANHAGTIPADALMMRLDVHTNTGRHTRELAADLFFQMPFIGHLGRKTGATLAKKADAGRLLERDQLVAVWPEGYKGIGKHYKDRYKLQRFGRGGFVEVALRHQVPIVPTAIVGSEEIYPLLFDVKPLAKALGLPYFPITAQMLAAPLLGPVAALPLPSKWAIEYGEPIDVSEFGPDAADDPMVVFDLTDRVRDTIQQMLYRNLMGRRSVFL